MVLMTVAMSSEGDSSKSVLSESNEKSGTDNNTDSSQDSHDVADAKAENATVENDVESKTEPEKPKEETDGDDKSAEKKVEADEKNEDDKKAQSESEEVESKDNKKDKKEKVEKDEEKSEDSEKDDEEDEKDSKKEVPLLDQPLEMSGKRERKNVQRLEITSEQKDSPKIEFDNGPGTSLGDIPRVDASISRFKNDDLKLLHRLLFKVVGKTNVIKKNIRKFNGFDFKKDSEEYTKKVSFTQKFELKQLKSICEMLDLPKTGSKDDIVDRIIDFLLEPKDSGRGRPKRTAAVKANNRGYSSHDDYSSDERQASRARRDKGKRTNLKDDSSSDEEFQPNQSDGSEDNRPKVNKRKRKGPKKDSSEEEASEVSVASSEESDDEPKSKRKKSPVKANNKTKAKSTPGKRGRPPATPKKTPSRGKKSKESSEEEEESDHKEEEGSSSEDEPLAKKAKNTQPPTDDEIKTFIKGILEGANLEQITMKTVCQRVYGHYPDFDLTHKKDFIKSTVKSLIST